MYYNLKVIFFEVTMKFISDLNILMKTNPLRISPACDTIMSKFAIFF